MWGLGEEKRRATVEEIRVDIVAADVTSHSNNRRTIIESTNHLSSRTTIQVWHHNIHQDQIIFIMMHFRDGDKAVIRNIDFTLGELQEL